MTSIRRTATDADLTVGAIVYKGFGAKPWVVRTAVTSDRYGKPVTEYTVASVATGKASNLRYTADAFTVEA